jgi:hypothetical protein
MRCGTSIGSNAEEAQEGQSKADFIAKLSISRREARETSYWLRLAVKNVIVVCPLPSALLPLTSYLCPVRIYFLRPIFFSAFASSSSVTSVAVVQLPIPLHNT